MADDWERLDRALGDAGVGGLDDLGRFVNDTTHLAPSSFDERAAMPVLLELLPTLTDRSAISAVAGHLSRPWAKPVAFVPLRDAFVVVAPADWMTGWKLADAMARTADASCASALIDVAFDPQYGKARQMLVDALWRFRTHDGVVAGLLVAIEDPDVALHAMSALRRAIGNDAALPELDRVAATSADAGVRDAAARTARKARKAIERAAGR